MAVRPENEPAPKKRGGKCEPVYDHRVKSWLCGQCGADQFYFSKRSGWSKEYYCDNCFCLVINYGPSKKPPKKIVEENP